jgi:hypothetical protein
MNHPTSPSTVRSKGAAVNGLIAFLTVTLCFGAHFARGQTPTAPQFEGSLDKVEVATLGGWVWDVSKPNTPIKVDIYDGTTLLASVVAQEYREDLKVAGKGDGKHAFNYVLPQTLRDGQSHTIGVKYGGTTLDLPASPKTLLFPKP